MPEPDPVSRAIADVAINDEEHPSRAPDPHFSDDLDADEYQADPARTDNNRAPA